MVTKEFQKNIYAFSIVKTKKNSVAEYFVALELLYLESWIIIHFYHTTSTFKLRKEKLIDTSTKFI